MAAAFATVDDVTALYGAVTADDTAKATRLLDAASALLRAKVPGIDLGVAATDPVLVATVVAEVVARALRNPGGVKTLSRTTGPFSESVSYADAAATGLFFSDDELVMLGGSVPSTRRGLRTFRVGTTEPRRATETVWPITW